MHEKRHALAETLDGQELYVHEQSVVGGLSTLAVGDEVRVGMRRADAASDWIVERTGRRCA